MLPGKNICKSLFILFLLQFVLSKQGLSQLSITGPTCVQLGTQYQYTISGSWTTSTFMEWQIVGGVIAGTSNSYTSGTPKPSINVVWNSPGGGSVSLKTGNPTDSKTKYVSVSGTLNGGSLSNSSQTIAYNTTPSIINSASSASGGGCSPSYTYQWQQSYNSVDFTDVAGQTGLSLSFSAPLTTTTFYRRMVTESVSGSVAYSNTAAVYVNPPLNGGTISPSRQDIFADAPAANLGGTPASGGTCSGSPSYSWEYSTDNYNFYSTGVTTDYYTPGYISSTRYYRRKATCGTEQPAYSNVAAIYVYQHLSIGGIAPGSKTITYNTSPGTLSATASGGICASYSYQWQQSNDNSNWSSISGVTSNAYTPGNLTTTTYYRLIVTCGNETVYSTIQIVVAPPLQSGSLGGGASPIYYNRTPGTLISTLR